MSDLLEPLQYAFMQRALLATSLASVACALVGAFVVLKGMAFMGDAVAHSSLAGMAAAYFAGINVFWGAFAWAVPAAAAITYISRRGNLKLDTAIGIIFAGGFALGIILMSRVSNYTADLFSTLFGNALGVSWADVWLIAAVTGAALAVLAAFYKELLFTAYDATMAAASGIPVRFVQYLLPALIAVTTVVSIKAVGVALVLALLVTPPATATLLARRLPAVMGVSVALALVSTVCGLWASFYLSLPTGPSIVMVATLLFGAALLLAPRKGLLWRRRRGEPAAIQS